MKLKNVSKQMFVVFATVVMTFSVLTTNVKAEEATKAEVPVSVTALAGGVYTIEIPSLPLAEGVFYESDLARANHLTLASPVELDERVANRLAVEGLACIETFIQNETSRRSELIIFDPAELAGEPLKLKVFEQHVQLDGPSRVLQVGYLNTSGLEGAAYLADDVSMSDYLYVSGEKERADGLWSIPDHFFMSDVLISHINGLISSYIAFDYLRDEVYTNTESFFDANGIIFDYESYFKDCETFIVTDQLEDGTTRTRRAFLTDDKFVVLSMTGMSCVLYSLPQPGREVTANNFEWFDVPKNRTILCPEQHLFCDENQGIYLYSVFDKDSRLITNWDDFVALRTVLGK